jgi:hypothetical protein
MCHLLRLILCLLCVARLTGENDVSWQRVIIAQSQSRSKVSLKIQARILTGTSLDAVPVELITCLWVADAGPR